MTKSANIQLKILYRIEICIHNTSRNLLSSQLGTTSL